MYVKGKPDYTFGGQDGSKPIIIQDGRVYDVNGNPLDTPFLYDETAERLIKWLWDNNYCITPDARGTLIREKTRVRLERQVNDLNQQNLRLMQEETARMETQLADTEARARDQIHLHTRQPERVRPPLQLTDAEREVIGRAPFSLPTETDLPEPPDEDFPQEVTASVKPKAAAKSKIR